MRKKTIMLTGMMMVLISTTGGCKKKDTAVQTQSSAVQKQTSPAREQIPQVKFVPSAPTNLPNVQATLGGVGNLELINDVKVSDAAEVKKKSRLSIVGWTANEKDATIPPTVIIQLNPTSGNNVYYAPASRTKQKRPDIAKAMNIPAFENSGFELDADISDVQPDKYLISILLSDGKYIIGFDTKTHLVVK